MSDLLNFDLRIDQVDGRFRAHVTASPAGETSSPLDIVLPFALDELASLAYPSPDNRNLRPVSEPSKPRLSPQEFGSQLFAAVFRDDIRTLFERSIDRAQQKQTGLRIRLRMNDAPGLAAAPWEYLRNPDQDFLALSKNTPVVRYLEVQHPAEPLTITFPLRVLVVAASPSDLPILAADDEWKRLLTALEPLIKQGKASVERLPTATLYDLQGRLQGDAVHVFHFIGHGAPGLDGGRGGLAFEHEDGRAHLVTQEQIGRILHNHAPLRLVFLNACEGAVAGQQAIFAGPAQDLVRRGIPAVVAMQFPVTDRAAVTLAQEFYRALANGDGVDTAVTEARVAVAAEPDLAAEWATPALFLRATDGRLFEIGHTREVEPKYDVRGLENPYLGLRAFGYDDSKRFGGRETVVDKTVELLVKPGEQRTLLFVVGPSGSGKSSFAQAGLLPALEDHYRERKLKGAHPLIL